MTLTQGPNSPHLILAHGAGAGMDSDFMNTMAALLVERGIGITRFEFPYMIARRETGSRRPPNRQDVLLECWRSTYHQLQQELGTEAVFIGGKSMGGRMASLLADELGVKGLVCLGYPFHPQGKPDRLRVEHLQPLQTPALIVQGDRDALGSRAEVPNYSLSENIAVEWLPDGDHDFKPRVRSGHTHQQNLICAADAVQAFIVENQ